MKKKHPYLALLPVAALLLTPAYAAGDDNSKALEQARKELEAARDELKRAARELARVSREQGQDSPIAHALEFMTDENRAMLGIIMGRGPEKDGKLTGVRVDAITPDSGADKAGLKVGDVIVSLNGKSIAQKDADDDRPGQKLRAAMDELKVGDKIKVGYEREGKKAEVTVVAGRASFNVPVPPIPPIPPLPPLLSFDEDAEHDILIPGGQHMRVALKHGTPWELAALDENLAPYFKTKSGVLVTRAKTDDAFGLKSGDVIQKINGEAVKEPKDVIRRVAKAEAGSELRLDVVRAGKAETLKGKAPKSERREFYKRIEIETGDKEAP